MARIIVEAVEVKGKCAAGIKVGDKTVIDGACVDLEKSDKFCLYALTSIFPTIFACRLGFDMAKIRLPQSVVQCLDPGEPYTQGGTVYFKITREE